MTASSPSPARLWVVAIDGPAGAGKSTVARLLAQRLGFVLLDSGALYRGLALHLLRQNVLPENNSFSAECLKTLDLRMEAGVAAMRIYLGDEEVTSLIRDERVGDAASRFAVRPEVRKALLDLQRFAGRRWNIIAEGRDMGTVVFPDAGLKFFLVADLTERARRRYVELMERGTQCDPEAVRTEMRERDERDRARHEAPLVKAPDAVEVDTTRFSADEVVSRMMAHIRMVIGIP